MNDDNRRNAVIFDRDGTLFQVNRVWPDSGDWDSFNAAIPFDNPVPHVVALTHAIRPDVDVIVVSGRDGGQRRNISMRDSLIKHGVRFDRFFMRAPNDKRKDSVVKQQILDAAIRPRWNVLFAVDDRPQVVDMWQANGIPVLQVAQPEPPDLPLFLGLGG